jgi:hypothetical protein
MLINNLKSLSKLQMNMELKMPTGMSTVTTELNMAQKDMEKKLLLLRS